MDKSTQAARDIEGAVVNWDRLELGAYPDPERQRAPDVSGVPPAAEETPERLIARLALKARRRLSYRRMMRHRAPD